jgi:hypothetical protein
MSNIFTLENFADFSEKINIDELFDKKQKYDLNTLELYNKLLNRIHVRIKTTSKQKKDEQYCWYVVPELIIGVPKYDQPACIAYLIGKLRDNQFNVRYIHPNTLFILWNHWVPSYVRTELKNKTGVIVDEFGNKKDDGEPKSLNNIFNGITHTNLTASANTNKSGKVFTPINTYKPQGNLIYNDELLSKLDNKLS